MNKKIIKKTIQKFVNRFGYKIKKIEFNKTTSPIHNIFSMNKALQRCYERGLQLNTIIDVGASDGRWSEDCMKIFPNADYILIEAQIGHKKGLDKFVTKHKNAEYILAAAGPKNGTIYFDETDLFSGVASEHPLPKNCIEVPAIALDTEIKKRKLKPPYLLKLDTHGFELPILSGSEEILKRAELIIIETYNYKLNKDSLRYWEMCQYMDSLGFATIENVDFMVREKDNTFWQMDTFFIPKSNKIFSDVGYN